MTTTSMTSAKRPTVRPDGGRRAAAADTEWLNRTDLPCKQDDPEAFFPISKDSPDIEYAKGLCQQCPVLEQCDEYATENRISHGTWGGKSEWERDRERRKRNRDANALGGVA